MTTAVPVTAVRVARHNETVSRYMYGHCGQQHDGGKTILRQHSLREVATKTFIRQMTEITTDRDNIIRKFTLRTFTMLL